MILLLGTIPLVFAALPAYFYFRNTSVFKPLPEPAAGTPATSVLIPARDEAHNIADCIAAVLEGASEAVEVVVLDDHSTDGTAEIVADLAKRDPRVRLIQGQPLPTGWNGKQHACWQLARVAQRDTLMFLDADVRLAPGAVGRASAALAASDADLISGFPRQLTGSLAERMLIPLIHFVLLGFLSLRHMRRVQQPEFAAGCGQLFVTTREAYFAAGGHAAIRSSRHDGLKLPRRYLAQQLAIDLFDATDLARVRMYDGAAATWNGLAKNADEGVATPQLIVPVTAMLILGQVAPVITLVSAFVLGTSVGFKLLALAAVLLSYAPRIDAAVRFRQSWMGALLHPLSVLMFLAIQWWALLGSLTGRQVEWKGRPAASTS